MDAVVAKKLVEVALVVVLFTPVKFWRVVEPFNCKFDSVVRPAVAVSVPVKLAAELMVWPLTRPEVRGPTVSAPPVAVVKNRLVEEAVVAVRFVAKKLVVVALVPVALMKVKFCKVEDPCTKRFDDDAVPFTSRAACGFVVSIPSDPPAVKTLERLLDVL